MIYNNNFFQDVDENDGPTYFNRQPTSPPSLFDYTDCKSAKPSAQRFTKFLL